MTLHNHLSSLVSVFVQLKKNFVEVSLHSIVGAKYEFSLSFFSGGNIYVHAPVHAEDENCEGNMWGNEISKNFISLNLRKQREVLFSEYRLASYQ